VPKRKRIQREHTEDWQTIQQYTLWLLFKKLPEYAPRTKRKPVEVIQLPLPDLDENRPQAAFSS
jgi:hypothetical protein